VGNKASDDPITPEPFWFLNPRLHRLASEPVEVQRANRMTLVGSVRRWLWSKRDYPPIEWETSSSIYIGPSILIGRDPNGFEYPVFDGRGRVRIDVQRIRFHHGFTVRRLCQQGYMPWPEEPLAEPPAEPPKEDTKSDEPEHVKYGMPEPRSREQKLIQDFVIKTYGSNWQAVPTDTIIAAASKDKEFKQLVGSFPSRSTFERALGRKKD